MALAGLRFDLLDYTQELTEQGNLFYVERLIVESNTDSNDLTPTLTFDNDTDVSYTAINRSTRGFDQTTIERLGPLVSLALAASNWSTSAVGIHSLELHLRRLVLKVNLVSLGQQVEIPGRSVDPATAITFDINPFTFPEEARFVTPVPRRLYIDIKSAADVTPVLIEDDDTETNLTAINQATRGIVEFAILSGKRLKGIRLDGDFSVAGTVLYDIELDTYIPGNRQLSVG